MDAHNLDPLPDPNICPICGSDSGFSNTGVAIAEGVINVCSTCSGYFLFPPTMIEYTDSGWTKSRELQFEEDIRIAQEFAPRIVQDVQSYLGFPPHNVLEVGCGSGFMGQGFNAIGCEYTGVDIDSKSIEFARSKGINAHCLSAEDIGSLAQKNQKFDLILSSNVLEHVAIPTKALQELKAICGGVIVIIVPNPEGLLPRLKANKSIRRIFQRALHSDREIAYSIDGYWHNLAYPQRTLRYPCEQVGLKPLRISSMNINDRVYGFVQRNPSLLYKFASGISGMLGMDSEVILIANPK